MRDASGSWPLWVLIRESRPKDPVSREEAGAGFRGGSEEQIGGQKVDAGEHAADGGHEIQVFEGGGVGSGVVHGGGGVV